LNSQPVFVQPLSEFGQASLAQAGGKGANLGALIQAGFPTPPGFCVTTAAYRRFVDANRLEPEIVRLSAAASTADPQSLETASAQIRGLFEQGQIPDEIASEVRAAYAALPGDRGGPPAVAVRSSATAEDLPDMSFAGQQDTYLNIIGGDAVVDAVRRCWGSLWTARALGYRMRNHIEHQDVALAVVLQVMVPSEVSGVLFTANPLTGKRTETVIDATLGLGEALVSGQVEPDHYVVGDAGIVSKTLGKKAVAIYGGEQGGTRTVAMEAASQQALPDDAILELARLGRQIEAFFGTPQDIEWAWAGGKLYILQSRPVTSLYPLFDTISRDDFVVAFSLASVQGMFEPFTPFGMDIFRGLAVDFSKLFGRQVTVDTERGVLPAGGRLFLNVTPFFRSPAGHRFLDVFVNGIDPGSQAAIEGLMDDPRLAMQEGRMTLRTRLGFMRLFAPVAANVVLSLISPALGRKRLERAIDELLQRLRSGYAGAKTLSERLALMDSPLFDLIPLFRSRLVPAVAAGQLPFQVLLRVLSAGLPEGKQTVMELTRGLPYNVTTEMDLVLWGASRRIKDDAASARHFAQASAQQLAAEYLAGSLPPAAQEAIAGFMQRYGARGVGEIDMGRPRWQEEPTALIQALCSYLQFPPGAPSPEDVFLRGKETAIDARERLLEMLRQTPRGRLKAFLARFLIGRMRELGGLRESPKFAAIRAMTIIREAILASGREMVSAGALEREDDLFYLRIAEVREIAGYGQPDPVKMEPWKAVFAARRQAYDREKRRPRIPRVLLSDGTAYYEGVQAGLEDRPGLIVGSPVSPGVVEGVVHVVFDPRGVNLAPGEILVCPGTDPAWTPLFLAAGGLVMEVGGMMTHGSVVAREYGIPAVVGVSDATTRLKTGQRVRVDGSKGVVEVLD